MLKILHNLNQLQCKYKEKQFTLSSDTRFLDFGSSKVTTLTDTMRDFTTGGHFT